MALKFFNNAINSGMCPHPDVMYHDLQQAFIDDQWENTTALNIIEEQDLNKEGFFDKLVFHKEEVWLNYVTGQTSSGVKNGDDFVQLSFKSLEHPCLQGRYYKFDNNYWLSYFTDEYDSIVKTMAVRRCNNFLKIIDPDNGELYSIPCVIEYDMSSPSLQISRYVITPNNHATVRVQGNADTIRLFKLNTRYILSGRPFKLNAYQNAIFNNLTNPYPSVLYLDLYLDEIHDKDDLINQIADNGEYNYKLTINSDDIELEKGVDGKLTANVLLNEEEVSREVVWTSSNEKVVSITKEGVYTIVGEVGQKATIQVTLVGNEKVYDRIKITVSDKNVSEPIILFNPDFNKICEHETIESELTVSYNGIEYYIENSEVSLSPDSIVLQNKNLSITKIGNKYIFECNKLKTEPINLYLTISHSTPSFTAKQIKTIKLVNMLG